MRVLQKLNDATNTFLESLKVINEQVNEEIWNNAPILVHQRLCHELVKECSKEENKTKTPSELPRATNILTAISLLEELYPKLKDK